MDERCCSGDAVSIKVSVDANVFAGKQSLVDPGYCPVHIGELEGVVREASITSQEGLKLLWFGDATVI